jgi:hypothetical protein
MERASALVQSCSPDGSWLLSCRLQRGTRGLWTAIDSHDIFTALQCAPVRLFKKLRRTGSATLPPLKLGQTKQLLFRECAVHNLWTLLGTKAQNRPLRLVHFIGIPHP